MWLIVEKDAFVRTDIVETIHEYHGEPVDIRFAKFEEIAQAERPQIAFINAKLEMLEAEPVLTEWKEQGVVLVATNINGHPPPNGWFKLVRPFASHMMQSVLDDIFDNKAGVQDGTLVS